MRIFTFLSLIFSGCLPQLHAQSLLKDSVVNCVLFSAQYTAQVPFGNMRDRYGFNSTTGGALSGKFGKNFILGIEGAALYGNKLKEGNILNGLLTEEGQLITLEGLYAGYGMSQRGFTLQANFGKLIAFKKPNVNSGLLVSVGVGMLQHKIRFEVDEGLVPQLNKQYQKGYDRLTNGFSVSEFIGYLYLDPKKFVNVYAGIEFTAGFTKNRREWNYDENRRDDKLRKDLLLGFKVGWILPFYPKPTERYYYN